MPLKLIKRGETYYLRGTVRGQRIFEFAGTGVKAAAEALRVKAEARLLAELIHGKVAVINFQQAAAAYVEDGAPQRYILEQRSDGTLKGLAVALKDKLLKEITQEDLDRVAREMYPTANGEFL